MRIVCISDTHGLHDEVKVPDGDILIHAGDHCNHGRQSEVRRFDAWMAKQPHKHKIFIAGNHDWPWQKQSRYALMWTRVYGHSASGGHSRIFPLKTRIFA